MRYLKARRLNGLSEFMQLLSDRSGYEMLAPDNHSALYSITWCRGGVMGPGRLTAEDIQEQWMEQIPKHVGECNLELRGSRVNFKREKGYMNELCDLDENHLTLHRLHFYLCSKEKQNKCLNCCEDWMKIFTFWKFRIIKKLQTEINNPNRFVFFITNY